MSYKKKLELEGVIPATLISFNENLSIDEKESRRHISFCAGTKGKRSSLLNSRIMIHQPLGGARGQASDIRLQADEAVWPGPTEIKQI